MKLREIKPIPGSETLRVSITNFAGMRFVRLQTIAENGKWVTVSSRSVVKDIRVDPVEAMRHAAKTLNLL